MRVDLIDLKNLPGGCDNKDQTGTYGSSMNSAGVFGRLFAWIKKRQLVIPYLYFAYAAAILRARGHEVRYFEKLPDDSGDIAIFASSIAGHAAEIQAAQQFRQRAPKTRLGFVGAFASSCPDLFFPTADFVVQGEPENFFSNFPGPRDLEGVIASSLVSDLDSLPFPDWRGFPVHRFRYFPMLKKNPMVPMLGSRGCPYGCYYCPHIVMSGKTYRARSAENMVSEIVHQNKTLGIRGITFRDSIFSFQPDRIREFCRRLLALRLDIAWGCETRTDCLTPELLSLMHQAGMRYLNLGIESADDAILKGIHRKPTEHRRQEDLVDRAERLGILVSAFYMLGSLSETPGTAQATIAYACRIRSSLAQFDLMTAYPGTPFYEEVKGRLLDSDFSKFTTYSPTLRLDHLLPHELEKIKAAAYRCFYFRPHWIFTKAWKVLFQ